MDQEDNYDDYRVGYKKPPKASQFQKGRSGNPKTGPKRRQVLTRFSRGN